MSYFTIKNFTRYNTEDLEAVLRLAEQVSGGHPALLDRYQKSGPLVAPVIMVKTYKPSALYRTEEAWNGPFTQRTSTQVRIYVKAVQTWSRPQQDVRLVDPKDLYDTPIEALAAVGGVEVLPKEAVRQLCKRFSHFFSGSHTIKWESPEHDLPVVRVEAKKQGRETQAVKQEAALYRANKSWADCRRHLQKAREDLMQFEKRHTSAMGQLKRSKAVPTDEQNSLDTRVGLLLEQMNEVERCLNVVQGVSPKND